MSKLLLVDGNAVLHRAYYALPDWRNRSGEATAGVYGFLSILLKAIEELSPTHVAIVFDHPGPTFRNNMYVGYQATREKNRQIAEDIWGQIEKLRVIFEHIAIPTFQIEGFEADDTLGTIAKKIDCDEVVIITGDKDLMQLVDEKIKLFMPLKGLSDMVLFDVFKVKERLGVGPELVIDYKALVGDSSDNYPGVPGIGPKTAISLLEKFGGFEGIYNASSNPPLNLRGGRYEGDINEALGKKLINGYESGELSKRLATIKIDVPVELDLEKAKVPSREKIESELIELGYKSLVKRLNKNEDSNSPRLFE